MSDGALSEDAFELLPFSFGAAAALKHSITTEFQRPTGPERLIWASQLTTKGGFAAANKTCFGACVHSC